MSGRRSRDKGARTERAIAKVLTANGFAAVKSAALISPVTISFCRSVGRDLCVEVKVRADGFRDCTIGSTRATS